MKNASESNALAVRPLHQLWAIVIVFLVNFCLLVLEIVAGRLMAPIVGVNLYTWTSIIGVILTGISIGNYLGGIIADRWASRSMLATLFILSGLTSASILGSIKLISPLTDFDAPLLIEIILIFSAVFLLPSIVLGTISPIVIKLTLTDLKNSGNIVGKIYAAGSVGSILGTFATGFFLISTFGTRLIIWCVASGLILVGTIIGLYAHRNLRRVVLLFYALSLISFKSAQQNHWLDSQCLRETNYFCINVLVDGHNPSIRLLMLDRLIHSYVDLNDPTYLGYDYESVYAAVLSKLLNSNSSPSVLFIGGGGYTFPRYMEIIYPNSQLSVVEIDPGVTETAIKELGLSTDTNITTYNDDARHFMTNLPAAQRYDLIIGDAANDFSVPYHLTTLEFDQLIAKHLADSGLYISNIIDGQLGLLLRAYIHTLKKVFNHVYVSPEGSEMGKSKRNTYVVVATDAVLNLPIEDGESPSSSNAFLSKTTLERYLEEKSPLVLTDDHVPVDNLLVPMFSDSDWQ